MQKKFITFSGFSGAIAIAMGAMGAHFMRSQMESGTVTAAQLSAFETGAAYHLYHSIALLVVSLLLSRSGNKIFIKAGYCFMAGIFLFSGSLYLLATGGIIGLPSLRWLGPITPIGGLFFIAGWTLLAAGGMKKRDGHNPNETT
jgi:uncharacterized membrane protein YgdD (TMEM256/DUF423 family)